MQEAPIRRSTSPICSERDDLSECSTYVKASLVFESSKDRVDSSERVRNLSESPKSQDSHEDLLTVLSDNECFSCDDWLDKRGYSTKTNSSDHVGDIQDHKSRQVYMDNQENNCDQDRRSHQEHVLFRADVIQDDRFHGSYANESDRISHPHQIRLLVDENDAKNLPQAQVWDETGRLVENCDMSRTADPLPQLSQEEHRSAILTQPPPRSAADAPAAPRAAPAGGDQALLRQAFAAAVSERRRSARAWMLERTFS